MYKKAILFLVAGVAIFYGLAMAKMVMSKRSTDVTNVVTTTPDPEPAPIVEPPTILTPPVDPALPTVRPRIDVVFTIDSTGSMGDEIEVVKQNIRDIISEISQGQPAPDVRYGIVTYRDRGDQYVTKSWQFTRDVQQISKTLSSIVADGGGDKPEAVSEALHVTLHNMSWDVQAKSKIVFLIGDAGPNNYPNDFRWQDEVNFAQKQNIRINAIACSGIEADEERVFNSIADPTNGMYAHLTYKQEYARADGSKAVVIEEAGRTFEVSKDAADKDWSRGADELIARNEAKEISVPTERPYYSSDAPAMSAPRDMDSEVAGGVEGGVVGGVVGGVIASNSAPAAEPMAPPPPSADTRSMGFGGRAEIAAAKPSAPARLDDMAKMKKDSTVAVGTKTNNLNTILADSIKREARKLGATYGAVLTPSFDFKGTTSTVKSAKQLLIDNKAQLQSLLGASAGVDINRIDFNNQFVLAVFLGSVAGDSNVTINTVTLNGNDLIVSVKQQIGKGSPSATPFHLIVLPRQQGSVKLDVKNLYVKFEMN